MNTVTAAKPATLKFATGLPFILAAPRSFGFIATAWASAEDKLKFVKDTCANPQKDEIKKICSNWNEARKKDVEQEQLYTKMLLNNYDKLDPGNIRASFLNKLKNAETRPQLNLSGAGEQLNKRAEEGAESEERIWNDNKISFSAFGRIIGSAVAGAAVGAGVGFWKSGGNGAVVGGIVGVVVGFIGGGIWNNVHLSGAFNERYQTRQGLQNFENEVLRRNEQNDADYYYDKLKYYSPDF